MKKNKKINLEKLLTRIELKSKFNFKTFTGFALESVNAGEKKVAKLGYQINIQDNIDIETKLRLIQNTLDNYVYPEIINRVERGQLKSTFRLTKAHVLLYTRHAKNKILLENEVMFNANCIWNEPDKIEIGKPVLGKEIKKLKKIFPRENYDTNAAQIMLVKMSYGWEIAVDLIFDRNKVKERINKSKRYFKSAENNLKDKNWDPFIDDIWTSTELAVQSILLIHYMGDYSVKQTHEQTLKLFKGHCEHNNSPKEFSKHYEKMHSLRNPARYVTNKEIEFKIELDEGEQYFQSTKKLLEYVENMLKIIDLNRKSDEKIMIQF